MIIKLRFRTPALVKSKDELEQEFVQSFDFWNKKLCFGIKDFELRAEDFYPSKIRAYDFSSNFLNHKIGIEINTNLKVEIKKEHHQHFVLFSILGGIGQNQSYGYGSFDIESCINSNPSKINTFNLVSKLSESNVIIHKHNMFVNNTGLEIRIGEQDSCFFEKCNQRLLEARKRKYDLSILPPDQGKFANRIYPNLYISSANKRVVISFFNSNKINVSKNEVNKFARSIL